MSLYGEADYKQMCEEAEHATINGILQKMVDGTHVDSVVITGVVLHHIVETQDVDTSYHARLAASRDKKAKVALQPKKWVKMVVCMDTEGTGFVLVFDDMTTAVMCTKLFDSTLEVGMPFVLLPCRFVTLGRLSHVCHFLFQQTSHSDPLLLQQLSHWRSILGTMIPQSQVRRPHVDKR